MPDGDVTLIFESEKKRTIKAIKKRIKRIEKGVQAKAKELDECAQHEHIVHLGNLLKANFHLLEPGQEQIVVHDFVNENTQITIPLDPTLSPQTQLAAFYKKAKKLKKGTAPLKDALLHLQKEQQKWTQYLLESESIFSLEALKSFQKKLHLLEHAKKKEGEKAHKEKPFHHFLSASGLSIFVGKNQEANDLLTFQYAKSKDIWLHAHQVAGSHVIIRAKTNLPIDQDALLDAALLAAYFSKARAHLDRVSEVAYTTRNHVFRIKGAPKGKVALSSYKILHVRLDTKRICEIKERHPASS
jgi:predicted ribosome quality control (RQC) complex YloA/Tae2 family protein